MADPATMQQQEESNSDKALKVFFAWLPSKEFHRCRCLSRKWAGELTSDEMIDKHLSMRGKIQLDYYTIMQALVLKCSGAGEYTRREREEEDGEIDEQTEGGDEDVEDGGEDEAENSDDDEEDEEGTDWREEYRLKGYVAVDKDYYTRRAEMEAFMKEEWAKIDFSGLTFADSDDEMLQACTVTLGALPPRIRLPVLETQGEIDIVPIRGREKTEEDVDHEIIAFLCHLRNMDPQPQFLKEFNTYRYPPSPAQQEQESDTEEELIGQGDNLDSSDIREVDVEDSSADSDYE